MRIAGNTSATTVPGSILPPMLENRERPSRCLTLVVESGTISVWLMLNIQSHYQEATLEKVAEKFNYSPKQVGRIVKDCTGEAFGDVIRGMKMKKAAELLLDRKYPPEQVAPLVGFATVNSFYRSFKDYYGLPPLEWVSRQQEV